MLKEIWEKSKEQIIESLPASKTMWLKNAEYDSESGNELTLSVTSSFYLDNLKKNCLSQMENTVSDYAGQPIKIELIINANRVKTTEDEKKVSKTNNSLDIKKKDKNETLNQAYTFDNFIIGENNIFACNVAKVIAKNPGTSYNPCLIYGGVGLGKTHLTQAIGNYVYDHNPRMKVIYVTAETFTNELIQSITVRAANNKFKSKYRSADVLLIDDIHFIANKETTQEEIFHTFNELTENYKQIVVTCDRPLTELTGINERLITRFRKGVSVDLQPPQYETRMAIAQMMCKDLDFKISNDVLEFICLTIKTNVRDLQGAIMTLNSFSKLVGKTITKDIAAEHIKNFIPTQLIKNNDITIDQIVHHTSAYFNVNDYELRGKGRNKTLTIARHISMYLANELTNLSLTEIGKYFNSKDHTTVSYALNKIKSIINTDESVKIAIDKISENLKQ